MRRLAALIVAVALTAACGSNVSREEIRSAAGASLRPGEAAVDDRAADPGGAPEAGDTPGPAVPGDGAPTGSAPPTGDRPGGGGGTPASGCVAPCAPLVIGAVGTWSGLPGQNVVGGLDAVRAWVASVNASGGLAGHEVRLEVADDGSDPARHGALVQEFVEQRGVVAFVYNAAVFSGQASVPYLERRRIPVVGGSGTEPWYTTSPMFFTQIIAGEVAIEATVASYARSVTPRGMTRMGLVTCSDGVQVCQDTARSVPKYVGKYGMRLAYQGQASLATPDFTANCLAARDAGVELLYLALDANSYQRFGRSCASIGYRPLFGIAQPVMLGEIAQDPNLQGSPGVSYTAPFFDQSNAAIAEFQAALAKYAPNTKLAGSASLGWSAAKLLEAAAEKLSGTPTSVDILQGLWALDGEDLGGLTAPLRFARDAPNVPSVCYWQVVVTQKAFRSPDGGRRHCERA